MIKKKKKGRYIIMANLHGKGAFENVSLIVKLPAKGVIPATDGKKGAFFLEIQVDQSLRNPDKVASGESKADTNPYLVSYDKEHPNGGKYVSHRDKYWENQFKAIEAAAKDPDPKDPKHPNDKIVTLDNGDKIYGIQASLTKNARGNLMIDTTKPMSRTRNPYFGRNTLEKQEAVTKAAKDARAASREAAKAAPEKENVAEAENQVEEPEV
jgi:hypothetical protein